MGYDYDKGIVSVPAYRTDILHEVDLIEDIAIAYGYDNFKPEIPEVSAIGQADKKEIIKSKIADILAGLNFLETSSYHLTTKNEQVKKIGLKNENSVYVKESKTEYNLLRKDLSHYMLKIFGENADVEYPQDIFQIGKIFEGYKEKESLAIASAPGNFTKLKQVLEYFAKMLGVKFEICEPKDFPVWFIDGRVGEIKFNNVCIGFLGEVHPRVLKNFRIKMPVSLCEIELEKAFEN
jgi:phenylalanyl-tRNA synthetase beta chain